MRAFWRGIGTKDPTFRLIIMVVMGSAAKKLKLLKGMVKNFYEAPEMEVVNLTVEAGFAASDIAGSGDAGGADSGFEDEI